MSKKMLKRSLVLGALMTFVITGSAMAGTEVDPVVANDLTGYKLIENGIVNIAGAGTQATGERGCTKWNLGSYELEVTSSAKGLFVSGYEISGATGSKLTIESDDYGIAGYGTVDVDALEIQSGGHAIVGYYNSSSNAYNHTNDSSKEGITDIIANKINVTTDGTAVWANASDIKMSIKVGEELKFNAGNHGIGFGGANSEIAILKETDDSLTNITITADGNVIQTRKENAKVTIKGTDITLKSNGVYEPEEDNKGHVIYADKVSNKVDVTADNDLTMSAIEGKNVIYTQSDATATVSAEGVSTITGNITAKGTSQVTATLNGEKSVFSGAVKTDGATTTLNLNGATWNVTGTSNVTTLAGSNANLVVSDLTPALVTVDTDDSKQLTVTADASVEGLEGDAETKLKAVMKTVAITNDAGSDDSVNTAQITNDPIYEDLSANFDANGEIVGEVNKEIASANLSVNDMVAIGMMSWRAEMNDMNKRMGELRNANGEHGVWVRMVRGESEYDSVKNQYNQYQLGYDEKLSVDKRWTVGAAISYTDAENNFAEGNGESTNKALSIYGSKLNDDGTFVDLIAKYARLDNDFKTLQGQGAAEYDTNAYSFSAEVGKRIQQGKGLWIEPQVELTYGKVSAVDYVTDKGVNVAQDGMESLVGRIGFSLGKDIEKGNVYARASYLYDFDGETKATLDNDAVLENDLGGGWWEVGVGANINLSKATYIYADVEKTFGGEVDTNWQWNLGVRYSF